MIEKKLINKESLPILIGGDYNIIHGPHKKSNAIYNDKWLFLFNTTTYACNLRELAL